MLPVSDLSRAVDALHCIPADLPRNDWVRVLMAAHAAEISEAEAESWSAQAASFNARDFRDTWRSIKPGGGIGPGTLFKFAAEHGYRMKAEKRQPLTLAHPRAEPTRTAQEPRTPVRQGEDPCVVWNRCLEAPAEHPYIVAKAGLPDALRVVPAGDPLRIAGESMAGALVVPVQRRDGTMPDTSLTELVNSLADQGKRVNANDFAQQEQMLNAQANALNAIFGELCRRASLNIGE